MTEGWSQRGDVRVALQLLGDSVPALEDGRDTRWPDLTEAVHWLIDDTGWDERDPELDVGRRIVRTSEEASIIRQVVSAILVVHDRHGPAASDAAWYEDAQWPKVQELANLAGERFDAGELLN